MSVENSRKGNAMHRIFVTLGIAGSLTACAGKPTGGPVEPTDPPMGEQQIRIAELNEYCSAGKADDCLELGMLLWDEGFGASTVEGDQIAREALSMACDAGFAKGCAHLGEMIFDGVGGEQDLEKARTLYAAACEDGEGHGCFREGELMLGDEDEAARELFEKGCKAQCFHACSELAEMLDVGDGGPQDEKRALELWQEACEHEVVKACEVIRTMQQEDCAGDMDEPCAGS
jgi:hypothetical protein